MSDSSVDLCVTCFVDIFRPQAGHAAVRVLERRGAQVRFPREQTCCGQFSFNAGYRSEAAALAHHFLDVFQPSDVPTAVPVVMLSGSCAAMVIHEYPTLVEEDAIARGESPAKAHAWRRRAEALADRIQELSQWIRKQGFDESEPTSSRRVAHHLGCHMRRLLRETTAPQKALEAVGVAAEEPDHADECCGFGGTFSMVEPVVSTALADAKWVQLDAVLAQGAAGVTGSDLGCLMHLAGRRHRLGQSVPVWYLAEVIDAADQGQWPPGEGI